MGKIDDFSQESALDAWYGYWEVEYGLPRQVIQKQMKQYIENHYHYQRGQFSNILCTRGRILSCWKLIISFFRMYVYSTAARAARSYYLILDGVTNSRELHVFQKLLKLVGESRVLIVAGCALNVNSAAEFLRWPYYHRILKSELYKAVSNEFISGISLHLKMSEKIGVNMMSIANHIIAHYLHFVSVFTYAKAPYCIQTRQHQTSAIKNYLFRKLGGKETSCIQHNIVPLGKTGMYFDTDTYFSLGEKTADRAFEFGARIENTVPVGSLMLEADWLKENRSLAGRQKDIDILYLGINVPTTNHFFDSTSFKRVDYYETFRWLSRLSIAEPHLRIAVKHHCAYTIDRDELRVLKGSNVRILNHSINSYEVASRARCAVTYGSTMCYELSRHGIPTFFLDPKGRCTILPDNSDLLTKPLRIVCYEEFKVKIFQVLQRSEMSSPFNLVGNGLCMDSNKASDRIYEWFSQNGKTSAERYEHLNVCNVSNR